MGSESPFFWIFRCGSARYCGQRRRRSGGSAPDPPRSARLASRSANECCSYAALVRRWAAACAVQHERRLPPVARDGLPEQIALAHQPVDMERHDARASARASGRSRRGRLAVRDCWPETAGCPPRRAAAASDAQSGAMDGVIGVGESRRVGKHRRARSGISSGISNTSNIELVQYRTKL